MSKAYIALFKGASSRAFHRELLPSQSTKNFIVPQSDLREDEKYLPSVPVTMENVKGFTSADLLSA